MYAACTCGVVCQAYQACALGLYSGWEVPCGGGVAFDGCTCLLSSHIPPYPPHMSSTQIMAGQVDDEPGSFAQAMAYDEFKEWELQRRKQARLQAESEKKVIVRQVDEYGRAWGVGRRKSAVAYVSIWPGNGNISINKQPLRTYFSTITRRDEVIRPLVVCNRLFDVDVQARVVGGGMMGQAQAIRHGLAVALQVWFVCFGSMAGGCLFVVYRGNTCA